MNLMLMFDIIYLYLCYKINNKILFIFQKCILHFIRFTEVKYNGFLFDESPLVTPTDITPYTGNTGQVLALKFNDTVSDEKLNEMFSNIENEELRNLKMEKYKMENEMGIIISNHHLYWKPHAKFEKLRQIYVMLNNIYSLKAQIEQDNIDIYNDLCNKISKFENVEKKQLNKWPELMCGGKYPILLCL